MLLYQYNQQLFYIAKRLTGSGVNDHCFIDINGSNLCPVNTSIKLIRLYAYGSCLFCFVLIVISNNWTTKSREELFRNSQVKSNYELVNNFFYESDFRQKQRANASTREKKKENHLRFVAFQSRLSRIRFYSLNLIQQPSDNSLTFFFVPTSFPPCTI